MARTALGGDASGFVGKVKVLLSAPLFRGKILSPEQDLVASLTLQHTLLSDCV